MKTQRPSCAVALALTVGLASLPPLAVAQTINFAQSPLFLGNSVKPNVLVVLDNSQSMDGTMAGKLIAGNDASTRGNIARSVLRDTITAYRSAFRWGLASFGLQGTGLYTTYAYFFGSDAEVTYTNDCVAGLSASSGNRRCVANPQTANGYNFITYAFSGDDPAINDVLYTGDYGPQIYGIGVNGSTKYDVYSNRVSGTGWNDANFFGIDRTWSFTPTDAGYLPSTPPNRRMLWLRRAWGYYADISGAGVVNRAVQDDSSAHQTALMGLLAAETNNNASGELKNAAVFTPLAGTLGTVKNYFGNSLAGTTTPITDSCQRNFVLLATDGNPTGKTDGSMYTLAQMANTYNAVSKTWTFGTAASDVFSRVTALRSTSLASKTYDVQTYVIGLGDSVSNASSVATLNRMADLGGTGEAYLASDADALKDAFRAISVDITSRTAAASSVSLNAGSWSSGAKVYQGRFSSGDWSGQLLAFPVGTDGVPASKEDWDAGQRLNQQHWSSGRQILTYKPSAALGSRGVALRWPASASAPTATEIDPGMVSALNTSAGGTADGFGAQRLDYLRGNTAREERNCSGCPAPVFRNRPTSVLGDIVNSAPVYVGGPTGDFRDSTESQRYSSYAAARRSVAPMIYVGANDGMLHGFNPANGDEVFAYMPYAVRNRLPGLTANPFTHAYSVDGSPAVGDVFYGGAWRTLLVSGMAAGAPGLYALDITAPADFTEAKAANVVRWELADGDAGHIFGRPLLAKTRDGRWRAIVGNGYNSANGRAVLLLVDLETGALARIDTLAGGSGSPNGLSSVTALSSRDDGIVDTVYGGDLQGRLWKFDLSASSPSGWKVAYGTSATPLPLFAAASGQTITARPGVTPFPKGGYLVSFGTGRYIDIGDNGTTTTQALYGVWDNGAPVALADLQAQSVVSTASSNGNTFRLTTNAVGTPADALITGDNAITLANYYATRKGWKMTLPLTGERVVAEATVRNGRVVFSSLVPSSAACSAGGDGWLISIDVITGNRSAALDTNGDGQVTSADLISGTAVSGLRIGSIPAAPSLMRSSSRQYDDYLVNTESGAIKPARADAKRPPSRRAAWEQLQ